MKKLPLFLFIPFFLLFSCLSPEKVSLTDDKDITALKSLIDSQKDKIIGFRLEKTVETSSGVSQKEFLIDSLFFDRDFNILEGKDLSRVFQQASYDKNESKSSVEYTRKQGEKKGPLSLVIEKYPEKTIKSFTIVEEDENVLYETKSTSSFEFDTNQKLKTYSIKGYQKLTGMDASSHQVKGEILAN